MLVLKYRMVVVGPTELKAVSARELFEIDCGVFSSAWSTLEEGELGRVK